eukprot:TRINITY_DN8421_c0_g5_i1.p1 TRINITY_DN8421_c0_g5~~TRINITY_DN8421_c0_g5_i1.p1  ORF type:complete len:719 (+),score=69.74 TRINITY_DN8421_c0_g5_i1:271-2157(+)
MTSTIGQQISFFTFRGLMDPSKYYKACFQRLENWYLCIVLPASVSDTCANRLANEAIGLILLKHGRLSSVRGQFRQLDPIFRTLASLWSVSKFALRDEADVTEATGVNTTLVDLYLSLGVLTWSPSASRLKQDVQDRVNTWQQRWTAATGGTALVKPEGFALLLDRALVATSFDDTTFAAFLRLCTIEDLFSGKLRRETAEEADDVRCRSLFLSSMGTSAESLLPSHQYAVIPFGPWILFMIWKMNAGPASSGGSPSSCAGSDPFGLDLCIELLRNLPKSSAALGANVSSGDAEVPGGYCSRTPMQGAPGSTPCGGGSAEQSPVIGSQRGGGYPAEGTPLLRTPTPAAKHAPRRSSFPLPGCPLWKSKSSSRKARGKQAPENPEAIFASAKEVIPRGLFLRALETRVSTCLRGDDLVSASSSSAASTGLHFNSLREPRNAAWPQLVASDLARVRCAELASRIVARRCADWYGETVCYLLREWSDMAFLSEEHNLRMPAWKRAPPAAARCHVLSHILKGSNSVERVWATCCDDRSACGATGGEGASETALLGHGHAWRFQASAPYHISDVSPIISLGARCGIAPARAWTAVSSLSPPLVASSPSTMPAHASDQRNDRAFLQLDTMGEVA